MEFRRVLFRSRGRIAGAFVVIPGAARDLSRRPGTTQIPHFVRDDNPGLSPGNIMTTKKFLLPDLGEGLPDATIVEWYVKEGDTIRLDDNLVSMETAKAVVDVPSPVSGKVLKLAGGAGDVIVTGTMLAEFISEERRVGKEWVRTCRS